jgi:hypothetical protein
MASRTYDRSLNQQERAFWRDIVRVDLSREGRTRALAKRAQRAMDLADIVIRGYRERITWRNS